MIVITVDLSVDSQGRFMMFLGFTEVSLLEMQNTQVVVAVCRV